VAIETVPRQAEALRQPHVSDLRYAMDAGWIVPGQRVLDLGCGLSQDLMYLAEHGVHACGIDVSAAALARPAAERLQLLHADVVHLPFGDASFDVLLDRGCLLNVPEQARSAYIAELGRVLRHAGHLLLWHADAEELEEAVIQGSFEGWNVSPLAPGVGYALNSNGRRPSVYGSSRREGPRQTAF
jgi:ubiquinone/menaquinone biosynthesis C-methylase UbiE